MEIGRHTRLVGETTQNLSNYAGQHRAFNMDHGYGFFPMGDRNRVQLTPEDGVPLYEDRNNDKLDKYLKVRQG